MEIFEPTLNPKRNCLRDMKIDLVMKKIAQYLQCTLQSGAVFSSDWSLWSVFSKPVLIFILNQVIFVYFILYMFLFMPVKTMITKKSLFIFLTSIC